MKHDINMPGEYEYQSLNSGISIQRQWNKNRILLLRNLKFIKKDDIVLDAGCGSGNVVLEFAKASRRIEGWDVNPSSIRFLNRKIRAKKIKNAKTVVVDLLSLKSKPMFSKIILAEVIEHFSHKSYNKMLKNLNKCLLKNGEILITTPNDKSFWPVLEFLLNIIQRNLQRIPTFEDRHLGHFDMDKLTKIVGESGFEIKVKGTMNFLSPFLFFLPERFRDRVHAWESKKIKFGPLLYLIAIKK